ncbi:MAG TPA: LysR family transcriptional regulator [Xanthobacteraceae bacterium]|nr:LysR family transcriptional regulator [Xanthobacteraceae bacterium]
MRALDVDAVNAFVLVADLRSFTRAAEAQGTTQSAISLKLKRLERRLGQRLLERTPRLVRLSAEGVAFLDRARDLLAAHDRAVNVEAVVRRLSFGVSDHAAGPELAVLLARINSYDPQLRLDMRVAASRDILASFDRGELDAVIVRREGDRRDGETLLHDRFGWFAAPSYLHRPGESLRLATLSTQCGVRALAVRALDAARLPWVETFVGGGLAAVAAAVTAGLAVAPLAHRVAPVGAIDIGPSLSLPELAPSEVVLYSRVTDPRVSGAVRALAAAFRSASR